MIEGDYGAAFDYGDEVILVWTSEGEEVEVEIADEGDIVWHLQKVGRKIAAADGECLDAGKAELLELTPGMLPEGERVPWPSADHPGTIAAVFSDPDPRLKTERMSARDVASLVELLRDELNYEGFCE